MMFLVSVFIVVVVIRAVKCAVHLFRVRGLAAAAGVATEDAAKGH